MDMSIEHSATIRRTHGNTDSAGQSTILLSALRDEVGFFEADRRDLVDKRMDTVTRCHFHTTTQPL